MMSLARFQDRADLAARWLVVACAFAVPLPAAWISILSGLFLIAWMLSGRFAARWAVIRSHPVARTSLLLLGWMALAIAWSPDSPAEAFGNWWQFRELLLLPLMLSVLDGDAQAWRPRVLAAFFAGFGIALVTSFLRWGGVLPDMGFRGLYAGFGGRTGFSLMLAFVVFASIEYGRIQPARRLLWGLLGLVCFGNLFFINTGRTGQIVFLVLLPLVLFRLLGRRGLIAAVLGVPVLAAGLYFGSPAIRERIVESAGHIADFQAGHPETGDGVRLEFWRNTVGLIRQHPVFGGGTGSYAFEYRQLAEREGLTGERLSDNPHNEYLLIASQQGLIGLALFLALWVVQWRASAQLPPTERHFNRGLVLLMVVGDLFNSFILDNLEGHFYVLLTVALCAGWSRTRDGFRN